MSVSKRGNGYRASVYLPRRQAALEDVPAQVARQVLGGRSAQPSPNVMAPELAPGTIGTRFNNVRSVFRAAVRDRLIAHDPPEGVPLPRLRRRESAMTLRVLRQSSTSGRIGNRVNCGAMTRPVRRSNRTTRRDMHFPLWRHAECSD